MFLRTDIREVIEQLKEMSVADGRTALCMDFAESQAELSGFINGGHYKIINRTERGCLNYYVQIVYLLFKDKYGPLPALGTKELEKEKQKCGHFDMFNINITDYHVLEDYLKMIIHADEYVRVKSVKQLVATCCAVINLFHKKGTNY